MSALHLPLLLGAALAGCSPQTGDGDVVGSLILPDCEDGKERRFECGADVAVSDCEAFDLNPDFFALDVRDQQATLRIQRSGAGISQVDGLQLQIRDIRRLRGQLGEVVSVGPDRDFRAALTLFDTCPNTSASFELRGQLRFTAFGKDKGERVAGEIVELVVRDGRTGSALGVLHGGFDFEVERGPPHQRFSGR